MNPIAMGEILRRLTCKCASSNVAQKAACLFFLLQVGVVVRGGCEALIHVVRTLIDSNDENLYAVQVDSINAFNLADRSKAFAEI